MLKRLVWPLLLALNAFAPAVFASPPFVPGTALPDLVEKVMPGVANISSTTVINYRVYGMDDFMRLWGVPQEHKQSSLGSGFIMDTDGFILTNNHVVEQATEVIVTLTDKRQFRAKIIGKDQKMDLALLQIRDKNQKVPTGLVPVPFGDSDKVRIAETVFAVGNPFGLQGTVTAGIISAKNRTIGIGPFDNFLQTDASINPGNSGGPLFNLKGEVIGINSVIYSQTGQSGGLGFAIPANEAKRIIPELKRYGRVPRPWLGILGQPVTPQLREAYDLPVKQGILVYNLVQAGPADRSGLRQGDIVTGVSGASGQVGGPATVPLTTTDLETAEPNDLERALSKHQPNDQITLKVTRGRRTLELPIKLEELPRLDQLPQGIL